MGLLNTYSSSYFVAYAAGSVFLLLFCVERFDQPAREGSFVQELVPKHLATHAEYLRTFLIYFLLMWIIYTLLTIAGPAVLQGFSPETEGFSADSFVGPAAEEDPFSGPPSRTTGKEWFPLSVVLLLVGVSTKYPAFNSLERIVRGLTHRIIGIPDGVQKLAEDISRAQIDLDALSAREVEFIKNKYAAATGATLTDISKYYDHIDDNPLSANWVRLNFLYHVFLVKKRELPKSFDTTVLDSFSGIVSRIKSSIYDLPDSRILEIVQTDRGGADDRDWERFYHMDETVNTALRDIQGLIAACIAHSTSSMGDTSEAIKALKLVAHPENRVDLSNALITSFFVVFVFIFVVVFATPPVSKVVGFSPSQFFPADHLAAISWATATVFLHGSAAFPAWRYREHRRARWEPMRIRAVDIPARQYLSATLRAVLGGILGLAAWYVLRTILAGETPAVPSQDQLWIPLFGLAGAVTGFWVCYAMDVGERDEVSTARQLLQALMQGVTTGGMCYLLMAMMPDDRIALDFEIYAATIAGLTGLIIGLISIPMVRQAYRKAGIDLPEVNSLEEKTQ